jgi:hypothetical protein
MDNSGKYHFLFVSAPFGGIEVLCRNIQKVVATNYIAPIFFQSP